MIFLVDDNMYYASMRFEVHQLARQYSAGFAVVAMDCPVAVAAARNAARPPQQRVPRAVIERMAARIELPNPEKRPWERWSNILDCEHVPAVDHLQSVWRLVASALQHPTVPVVPEDLEAAAAARAATAKSVVHTFDVMSRKHLQRLLEGLKASGAAKKVVGSTAAVLNKSRRAIVDRIRAGEEALPDIEERDRLDTFLKGLLEELSVLCSGMLLAPETQEASRP